MTVLRRLKPLVFQVLCLLGIHHLFRLWNRNRLLVLMYHGFVEDSSDSPPSWLLAPVGSFSRQIEYLSRYYSVMPVSQATEMLVEGRPYRRPSCCLTFDDGYRNNFTLAYPILQRHKVPAAIYLATGLIGTEQIHWTVKLERAFYRTTAQQLDLQDLDLPCYPLFPVKGSACVELTSLIYRCHGDDRQRVLDAVFDRLGLAEDEDFSDFEPMSWGEVKEMKESTLVEFGGHTVSHAVVGALADHEIHEEITTSLRDVEAHAGWPVATFAYPNGTVADFDDRAKEVLKEAGTLAAFSTIRGLNDTKTDRYELRRIHVSNETTFAEFKLRTSGALEALRSLIGLRD